MRLYYRIKKGEKMENNITGYILHAGIMILG